MKGLSTRQAARRLGVHLDYPAKACVNSDIGKARKSLANIRPGRKKKQ